MADQNSDVKENDLLNAIINEFNLDSYEICEEEGSKKGDNYVGVIRKIQVKGTKNGQADFNLGLIVKQAPPHEIQKVGFDVERFYNREIFMYETVLPTFTKLEKDFNIKPNLRYPILYGTSRVKGSETIILEDLTNEGFCLREKRESLDWNHCQLSIAYLAKLHSYSFVLKKRNPDLFYLLSNLPEIFFNEKFFDYYMKLRLKNTIKRATASLDPIKEKYCIEKLQYFEENFKLLFSECLLDNQNQDYHVISHGDSWSNNIFYKYQSASQTPEEVCFIDWQVSRYASPLIDITYLIYSSTDKNFRKKYLQKAFDEYYLNLTENLKKFNEDIQDHFPIEEYQKHIKNFQKFGFIIAVVGLHMFLINDGERFSGEEMSKNLAKFDEVMIEKVQKDKVYRERLHDIIVEFCDEDLI